MGFKVKYTGKDGKAASAVFGSEKAANSYASAVKGTVTPYGKDAPVVDATKCPEATAELQKAATDAYYRAVKTPEVVTVVSHPSRPCAEQLAEMKAEHFFEARIMGQSMEDAQNDWDFINDR